MENYFGVLFLVSHVIFTTILGIYLILNLQWYSYKIERVLFHHKKPLWHIFYFLIPIILYYGVKEFFWTFLYFIYTPYFFFWYRKQDKKLVLTARVKRFLIFLIGGTIIQDIACLRSQECQIFGVLLVLGVAYAASLIFENYLGLLYKRRAKNKLKNMKELKIIGVTGSYGKTSIKNFLYEFLKDDFVVHKTPRSVNTLMGLIADINNNVEKNTEIYIAEAGARKEKDIEKITKLLDHQYAILGEVGEQHIEYFKTFENVLKTKKEIFESPSLQRGFFHEKAQIDEDKVLTNYSSKVSCVHGSLEGVRWDLDIGEEVVSLETEILGRFNAYNISAAFLMALALGVKKDTLIKRTKNLKGVKHRLEKIETPNKLIIDDSFNGNLSGMLEACFLASCYKGRKVIVTPGIVESDEKSNRKFAQEIGKVFDLVIITGSLNAKILGEEIPEEKRKIVTNKQLIEKVLEEETKEGDLIIFSNDTPTFM